MSVELGKKAEDRAKVYLENIGYKFVASNVRMGKKEIDLIMNDPFGTIVFVEVKYRKNVRYGVPRDFVTKEKIRNLSVAARQYLQTTGLYDSSARFDVVEVTANGIEHIENAFENVD